MKKRVLFFTVISILLLTSCIVSSISTKQRINNSFHRGNFYAELGIRSDNNPYVILDGSYRDMRGRHIITGTISVVRSERSNRFQGLITRQYFIVQTGYRNHIINIIGKFQNYDEINDVYNGLWRGYIFGYGWTMGWINAHL